ncbi:hypothetical protein PoB_007625900 [Plakobranchus ocellatus]|uniref:Uncharacterized protein n=1 Tax=Plakobranchus ocellatus TaxID=259542 RepID=A0AAV4E0E3_9GAST|nr:hypothetical protein PoB_007625900 [Plakobranchus ocellatus]
MVDLTPSTHSMEALQAALPTTTQAIRQEMCRDRYGRFNSSFFSLWACSLCVTYLFPEEEHLLEGYATWENDLRTADGDRLPAHIPLYPDMFHPANQVSQIACRKLGEDRCRRLSQCCSAAVR